MNEPFLHPIPIVVAHRGDSHNYPENTIEAFQSASKMGIDVIETDVHLTKDGQIVVWHDATLERNTNGRGKVEDHTLTELRKLDAGYTFSSDGGKTFPFRGTGVTMATLEEALESAPHQRFNIDLKSKNPQIVDSFIKLIDRLGAHERVLCASFHLANLNRIRRKAPHILTSLTTLEVLPLLAIQKLGLGKLILPRLKRIPPLRTIVFQVPVRQWGIEVVTPQFVKTFHRERAIIQVWTINEEKEMRRLFSMGVDSIMTDNPAKVIAIAKEMGLRP